MIERRIQEAIDSKCFEEEEAADSTSLYGFSKACLNVQTRDFADMHPSLIINSCTPGFVKTDMTAQMGATDPPETGTTAPLFCLFGVGVGTGVYIGSDAVRSPVDRYRAPGV
jgi:NAD(P)-dependent dehydrogenase (short-subunit alcohol dehydrogenase family)